jgi:hypothetical protein
MTGFIGVNRFNHLIAETTPLAAYLRIRSSALKMDKRGHDETAAVCVWTCTYALPAQIE